MQKKIKLKDVSSILFIIYLFHLVFMIFFNNITEIRNNKIFEYIYTFKIYRWLFSFPIIYCIFCNIVLRKSGFKLYYFNNE